MFAPGGMLTHLGFDKDEVTASVGDDYSYAKNYRDSQHPGSLEENNTNERERFLSEEYTKVSSGNSATMSKLGAMGDNLFADDSSFEHQFAEPEERFDVVAPAGKLGMVIDTPNGGVPVVHAIRDTSVLANSVRVGDWLLSVDGVDCTAMTAMQVSKLISVKSEKPSRVLVFVRSRTNATNGA
jgi:C-terminal processing protease CtpA/Prc